MRTESSPAASPTVRNTVEELPSGALVLGLANTVVLNDPITGQGSNNASKAAASYRASSREYADGPFDRAFMERAFERYWDEAQYVTGWTNALLAPPPQHVLDLFLAANEHRRSRIASQTDSTIPVTTSTGSWIRTRQATTSPA